MLYRFLRLEAWEFELKRSYMYTETEHKAMLVKKLALARGRCCDDGLSIER